jgi:hypothetical protein
MRWQTGDSFLSDEINNDEVMKVLNEMQVNEKNENIEGNPDKKSAVVCVVCDCIILDGDEMGYIEKQALVEQSEKLSITTYRDHFGYQSLNEELIQQYQVQDEDLQGLLLSPRAKLHDKGFQCCTACRSSLNSRSEVCPKYSIANGFAIGFIPDVIKFKDKNEQDKERRIDHENDLDDLICSAISPVRPFGYVHAYTGGCQKQIKGQFSLFSIDQSHVGGVLNNFRTDRGSKNIFVVLCGRMTPNQKSLLKRKTRLNTDLFLDLLTWFVKSSGHKGYKDVVPPEECPDPIAFVEDESRENNTADESVNDHIETQIGAKTYYFSSDNQKPTQNCSVYDKPQDFICDLLDEAGDPTTLMYGGSYLKSHEINLEDVFPIQFPFGQGGPNLGVDRRVKVSTESCLKHYMKLSLNQFMRPDFILVCYQLLCRSKSYTTGLIKCRSSYQGRSFILYSLILYGLILYHCHFFIVSIFVSLYGFILCMVSHCLQDFYFLGYFTLQCYTRGRWTKLVSRVHWWNEREATMLHAT